MIRLIFRPVYYVFLITVLLIGCRSKKQTSSQLYKPKSIQFLKRQLQNQIKDYQWISFKARLEYKDPYRSMKGTARIRAKKDSIIWVHISKLGFEGVRARISPDRIEILNRIDKTYLSTRFNTLNELYGFALDFQLLQDLLLGNPLSFMTTPTAQSTDSTGYSLTTKTSQMDITYHLSGLDYLIDRLELIHHSKGKLIVRQEDYKNITANFNYPGRRQYKASQTNGDLTSLSLRIIQTTLDQPVRTPFTIPDHYEKI